MGITHNNQWHKWQQVKINGKRWAEQTRYLEKEEAKDSDYQCVCSTKDFGITSTACSFYHAINLWKTSNYTIYLEWYYGCGNKGREIINNDVTRL
mmetsp:Transcript_45152/g.80745  ORF Transcript_45152/g.80745 Transcript_45152/m.80745 type:complete len:95 (+) Transcript_45152:2145-2429(+)